MKKLILLLVFFGTAAWWMLIGGRHITEAQARDFYSDYERATLSRQPDALCALLDDGFTSSGTVSAQGRRSATEHQNKAQTCSGYVDLYRTWSDLGDKMGGILQLDSDITIHSVTISTDGRTATVDVSTSLDVGGSLMSIRSRSTDTLVRKNGLVRLLRSEGHGSVGVGS